MSGASRKWLKGLVLCSMSVGLLAFVLTRVDLTEVWEILLGADRAILGAAFCFSLTAFSVLPTIRWRGTLRAMGYPQTFKVLLYARFGSQPLKFTIPMKGGEAFRAVYLRRKLGVPLTHGGGSIIFDMFLVAVGQLTFLCVGIGLAGGALSHALLPTVAVFGTGLALASKRSQRLLVSLAARLFPRLRDPVEQVAHGFLRFPLGTKLRLTSISYVVEFAEIFSMFLCSRALGLDIPMWAIFTFMPIVMAITLIPVTISGLGTRELAIFVLFTGFATPEQLAGVGLLFTLVEFITPALVGCFVLPSFLTAIGQPPVDEISALEAPASSQAS